MFQSEYKLFTSFDTLATPPLKCDILESIDYDSLVGKLIDNVETNLLNNLLEMFHDGVFNGYFCLKIYHLKKEFRNSINHQPQRKKMRPDGVKTVNKNQISIFIHLTDLIKEASLFFNQTNLQNYVDKQKKYKELIPLNGNQKELIDFSNYFYQLKEINYFKVVQNFLVKITDCFNTDRLTELQTLEIEFNDFNIKNSITFKEYNNGKISFEKFSQLKNEKLKVFYKRNLFN